MSNHGYASPCASVKDSDQVTTLPVKVACTGTAMYFACPVNQVGGSLRGDDARSFLDSPITALSTAGMLQYPHFIPENEGEWPGEGIQLLVPQPGLPHVQGSRFLGEFGLEFRCVVKAGRPRPGNACHLYKCPKNVKIWRPGLLQVIDVNIAVIQLPLAAEEEGRQQGYCKQGI
ncbi:hypothetical protein HYALB_00013734 [Hymenoscyphus albidus]|uniref:Uncharacterized protein n=1 Tax=Hymenoscyphus albidus TaxID=595503 RepID=A0A9N9LYK1_9HELO|nr:hypothetical protein HYALB_00013734 [Hymenoscyphus albidus]